MSLVYFTDRDLGKSFPRLLLDAGVPVERHGEHFPADCPDEVWLAEVGKRGWVALTHDTRIRYKPNEKGAVIRNSVRLIDIVGKASLRDLALVHCQPQPNRAVSERRLRTPHCEAV